MTLPNYLVFTGGIGDGIEARNDLGGRLSPDIEVVYAPVNWREDDYVQRRTEVGLMVVELAKKGRVSVAGDSVGGQFELGVFIDHPDHVYRAITYNTKMSGFDLPKSAFLKRPNMGLASKAVECDAQTIRDNPDLLGRVLNVTSLGDEQIDDLSLLTLGGPHTHTTEAWTHREAIERALTIDLPVTIDFVL